MSTRRTLKELLSEDDALTLIQKAIEDGNKQIKAFAACDPEDALLATVDSSSSESEDDDDEWAEQKDDEEENKSSKTPKIKKRRNDPNSPAGVSIGPSCFEHVTHRLVPIVRSNDDDGDENDGGEHSDEKKKSEAAAVAAAASSSSADPGVEQLLALQVTTRSLFGAICYHAHVFLAYNGMIRVLAAGKLASSSGAIIMHSVSSLTNILKHRLPAGCPIVAFDVFGGLFLINSGSVQEGGSRPGNILYLPPDSPTAEIECLGVGYTAFFTEWLMNAARVFLFYQKFLFDPRAFLTEVGPTEAYSFYPPLWTREGQMADPGRLARRAVPIEEAFGLRFVVGGGELKVEREEEDAAGKDGGEDFQ